MVGKAVAKRISPMLAVADIDETIQFYQSVLGFKTVKTSPEYSIVERDGQSIHFQKAASEEVLKCVRGHTENLYRSFWHRFIVGACEKFQESLQSEGSIR
jgi:catechol 2,3-dioxygenase-like lactoylglutathione lyase family enzyme